MVVAVSTSVAVVVTSLARLAGIARGVRSISPITIVSGLAGLTLAGLTLAGLAAGLFVAVNEVVRETSLGALSSGLATFARLAERTWNAWLFEWGWRNKSRSKRLYR